MSLFGIYNLVSRDRQIKSTSKENLINITHKDFRSKDFLFLTSF